MYPGWRLASSSVLFETLQTRCVLLCCQPGVLGQYPRWGLAFACNVCLLTLTVLASLVEYIVCMPFVCCSWHSVLHTSGTDNTLVSAVCRLSNPQALSRSMALPWMLINKTAQQYKLWRMADELSYRRRHAVIIARTRSEVSRGGCCTNTIDCWRYVCL